ncbi:PAS domain S-box protein [Babesia caballi]|uniref:PAS domain S-box protein n=1 Tax=Babesia caballi TaxID=5871 RepID=A0AAV4LSM6_BABCB|nr:PAS domain S-box protein [Babesia caballi]
MVELSKVRATSLKDLASMFRWLAYFEDSALQNTMMSVMLQQSLLSGMVDYDINIYLAFNNVVNVAVLMQRIPGLYKQPNPLYTMDVKSNEQVMTCFYTFVDILEGLYNKVMNFISVVTGKKPHKPGYIEVFFNSYYRSVSLISQNILTSNGFADISSNNEVVVIFFNCIQRLYYGHPYPYGLVKLEEWRTKFVKCRAEFKKHCSKPTLRDIMTRLKYLSQYHAESLETKLSDQLPVHMWKLKSKMRNLIKEVVTQIESMEACILLTSNSSAIDGHSFAGFDEGWDYLVRAVPYFEDSIKELRFILLEPQHKWTWNELQNDSSISRYFNGQGFGKTKNDLNVTGLMHCKEKIFKLIGNPTNPSHDDDNIAVGDLVKIFEIIALTFHERSMKSFAKPSCFKERLIWLYCLLRDSRHNMYYYNIHQSNLVTALTGNLIKAKLGAYVNQVITSLIIIPIRVSHVLETLTNKSIEYGFYQDAIFSPKYANEYAVISFEVLLELLREVHYIYALCSEKNFWHEMNLNTSEIVDRGMNNTNTSPFTLNNGSRNNDPQYELVDATPDFGVDASDYGLYADEGKLWNSKISKKDFKYRGEIKDGVKTQMVDWFLYQGFSAKNINTTLNGAKIHKLMEPLLLGYFGLQYACNFLWSLLDKTIDKFMVAPELFRAKMDWLAKLDSGDKNHSALSVMLERLVGLNTQESKVAAEVLHYVVYCASAVRRYLLDDTDDFGEYNDVFCIYTAVDGYLKTLYDVLVKLEDDFNDLKSHITSSTNKMTCGKGTPTTCDWLDEKGFKGPNIFHHPQLSNLTDILNKDWSKDLKLLRKHLGYCISIMEPENLKDIVEWCHKLNESSNAILEKLKMHLKTTVRRFAGHAQSSEIRNACDSFLNVLPSIREIISKHFQKASHFENAIFIVDLLDYYKRIFLNILSAVYQHWFNRNMAHSGVSMCEVEEISEDVSAYHVLQKPITELTLARDLSGFDENKIQQINNELHAIFETIFSDTNDNHNRKHAFDAYLAMIQGAPLEGPPDESNIALTAAVTTAVGTGAVGAGVVYFKFNALYAFFGKLLA